MREAIIQFSGKLVKDDPCAFLWILCSGTKYNFLLGSDNEKVDLNEVLLNFDDSQCPKMTGKPKIVVIQSLQSGKYWLY